MGSKENELIKSPLQQLEFQTALAKASPTKGKNQNNSNANANIDQIDTNMNGLSPLVNEPTSPSPGGGNLGSERDSIYSFDSVSTNGRLLDRLGLENEDLFDADEIQNGRFDRLSINDIKYQQLNNQNNTNPISNNYSQQQQQLHSKLQNPYKYATNKPISTSQNQSHINLERFPSYKAKSIFNINPNILRQKSQSSKDNQMFSVKNVPSNIAHPNRTHSIDSFQADINSLTPKTTSSSKHVDFDSDVKLDPIVDNNALQGQASFKHSDDTITGSQEETDEYDEFHFHSSSSESIDEKPLQYSKSQKQKLSGDVILSPPSDAVTRNRSVSSYTTTTKPPHSPVPRRTVSDYTTATSPNGKTSDLTPDARTRLSLQLRSLGKHREASYQLQIAANPPFHNIRAMYMYAMALKFGQGVKQNDKTSLKWLCKCILANASSGSLDYINKLNDLQLEDMLKLVILKIKTDKTEVDPFNLYYYYSKLPGNQISKIINTCKSQADVTLLVYHEFGNYLINGWGTEKDEMLGIKALSIAASMGNFNSMIALGELWCSKSKARKRDNHKASAWYRLSEVFGVKSIGNSWIYKDKYMHPK